MAFPADMTYADGNSVNKTFTLVGQGPDWSKRIDTSSTPQEPRLLIIRHSVQGQGAQKAYRHLLQLSVTKKDANTGLYHTAVINTTFVDNFVGVPSRTEINHLIAFQKAFENTSDMDRMLRNEI